MNDQSSESNTDVEIIEVVEHGAVRRAIATCGLHAVVAGVKTLDVVKATPRVTVNGVKATPAVVTASPKALVTALRWVRDEADDRARDMITRRRGKVALYRKAGAAVNRDRAEAKKKSKSAK